MSTFNQQTSRALFRVLARSCSGRSNHFQQVICKKQPKDAKYSVLALRKPRYRERALVSPSHVTSLNHVRSIVTSASLSEHDRNKASNSEVNDVTTSSTMPDITNFYTLFPKTLPNGPPQQATEISELAQHDNEGLSEATFHIDLRGLRREFLQLQSLHHPDKYPSGSVAHQKAYALSTLLNNAYKTLLDPLLRAQYLLQLLYNIDVTSEDNSAHPTDSETLMIVMEAQEELEEAQDEDSRSIVDRLVQENTLRIRDAESVLEKAFQSGNQEAARLETVKLKYWKSLESGLKDWEPGKEVRLTH